jgi:hypothetical protein
MNLTDTPSAERGTPTHGLSLRGGNKWPDPMQLDAHTRARLIKLTALEEAGVADWTGYESAMDHAFDIGREVESNNETVPVMRSFLKNTCAEIIIPPPASPPSPVNDIAIDDVVQEECAEVIQALSKVRRFGQVNHITGYDNMKPLETEMGQLYASLDRLASAWNLSMDNIILAANAKMQAIDAWAPFYERNRRPV